MAKQDYLLAEGYGLFLNGIQAERIREVSFSVDQSYEDIKQLSDDTVVQKISQTPDVSITVSANFIGGIDNLLLFANKAISVGAWSSADIRNNEDIRYSNQGNGTDTYERYDRIDPASANGVGGTNSISASDILNSYIDVTIPQRSGTTSLGRTLHVHRAALTGYSINLDVTGYCEESFNLSASNRYWFRNDWRGVRPYVLSDVEIIATAAADSGSNAQRFLVHSVAAFRGASCIGIFHGINKALANNTNFTFSHTTESLTRVKIVNDDVSTDTWANPFVSSPTDPNRDDVILMLKPSADSSPTYAGDSAANPGFELNSTAGSFGAVARQYAEVYLYNTQKNENTSTAQGKLLRCQSFNVDVSPDSEPKYQIGDKDAYATRRLTPVNVTGSFSVLTSDLQVQGILSGTAAGIDDSGGPNVLDIDDFNSYNHFTVRFYKDEDRTQCLSQLHVSDFSVSGESESISVGGEGAEDFSFTADNFELVADPTDNDYQPNN